MSEPIIIDTPDAFEHFHIARTIAMLSIEVNTGMTHSRGSVLKLAQQQYGIKSRSKAAALAEMKKIYFAQYGREYGTKP